MAGTMVEFPSNGGTTKGLPGDSGRAARGRACL